jgi:hypothetical protein
MFKKCRYCKHCYCSDETDVSGMKCRKNVVLKIIELDNVHPFCDNYKFSLLKLLLGV